MNGTTSIIQDMKSLGLSEYEAKSYLNLLEQNPVNGYILSKNFGIPRSRIYEWRLHFSRFNGKSLFLQIRRYWKKWVWSFFR